MWVYDSKTLRFLAVNDTAVARYGFDREEFLRMTITDLHPDKVLHQPLDQSIKPALDKPETARHRTKSGELIDAEIASHHISLEGKPARIVVARVLIKSS